MRRDYRTIDSSEPLEDVFMRIGPVQDYAIPVTQSGRLVGLLTSDNVAELFMLHIALEQSRHRKQLQAA
jgi:predicted transcriptional regulator